MVFNCLSLLSFLFQVRNRLYNVISVLLVLTPASLYSQQFSEKEIKAAYIYQFAQSIQWTTSSKTDSFTIAIFTDNNKLVSEFKSIYKNRVLHGMPIAVKNFIDIKNYKIRNERVLYIDSKYQDYIPVIKHKYQGKSVLLVGEAGEYSDLIMIYFGHSDQTKKLVNYHINSPNLLGMGLQIDSRLSLMSESKPEINELIIKKEFELQDATLRVENLRIELESLGSLMDQQNKNIISQRNQLRELENQYEAQKGEVKFHKELLEQLKKSVDSNDRAFKNKTNALAARELQLAELKEEIHNQQYKIAVQEEDIDRRNKLLIKLDNDITTQNNRIQLQRANLQQLEKRIEQQKGWLYLFALTIILSVVSIVFIFKAYRTKKLAGIILEEKNRSIELKSQLIEQQKEEIEAQAEMLERTNKELEKLSIVASETDNSVIIMDTHGNFDWVNPGFTKMTGFSLEDLKLRKGQNIRSTSSNPKIEQILDYCIMNRKAVIYDSFFQKFDSEIVWLQTTLTPIVKADGQVEKLVAIDSNITRLKEVERELQQSNEELKTQRDELTIQKGRIERQNRHITESIMYAQTIQKAILPIKEDVDRLYSTFIVYKPKDIVSGDFYWYTPLPDTDGFIKRTLIAVADCTGHGVPGAMMSMIGSSLLNETVHEKGITLPNLILKELDQAFRSALKQEKRNSLDGMEICLCLLETNEEATFVRFSGAKQSLYYYNSSDDSIFRVKATPREIGGFIYKNEEKFFELSSLKLNPGDCLYLCSDGFADQAGKDNLRYGKQRLLSTLREIGSKPLNLQQEILENSLTAWQQDNKQRDDITVVGIKI
jgi:PAS domain S-box-containing protein